jgi:hypothetical protein
MNHREAVERHAADRYLLDDLTAEERSEFEEHFFECPECAAEVEAGVTFVANARAVLAKTGFSPEPRRARLVWLRPAHLMALAAALILIICYQELLRVPRLKRELQRATGPQAYPAFFLRPVARGDDQIIAAPKSAPFVGLSLDIPPGGEWTLYECDLRSASRPENGFIVTAPPPASPGSPINLLVPTNRLDSGTYTLVLRGRRGGAAPAELGRFGFIVQID